MLLGTDAGSQVSASKKRARAVRQVERHSHIIPFLARMSEWLFILSYL